MLENFTVVMAIAAPDYCRRVFPYLFRRFYFVFEYAAIVEVYANFFH